MGSRVDEILGPGFASWNERFDAAVVESLANRAEVPILIHSPEGIMVFCNQPAAELLGYSVDELLALPPFSWIGPESQKGAPSRLEAILHDGRLDFSSSAVRSDGMVVRTCVSTRRLDTDRGPVVIAVLERAESGGQDSRARDWLETHDSVTGLQNLAAMDAEVASAIASIRKDDARLALASLDLEGLKEINVQYGREVGDAVLAEVAANLSSAVGDSGGIARADGDDFVVLIRDYVDDSTLARSVGQWLAAVRSPLSVLNGKVLLDAHVGVAVFDPGSDGPRSLAIKASIAMYEAKQTSSHRWLVYAEHMGSVDRQD